MITLIAAAQSASGSSSAVDLLGWITAFCAVAGIVFTYLRFRGDNEKDKGSLYISQVQGAALIQNELIRTLQNEIERGREIITKLEKEIDDCHARMEQLEDENEGLRKRHGTRKSDPKPPPSEPGHEAFADPPPTRDA